MRQPANRIPRRSSLAQWVFPVAAICWAAASSACNVPVFRYALEHWTADPCEVIVFHREPLTPGQQAGVESLEQAGRDGRANLAVSRINLGEELPPPWRAWWQAQRNATPPWLVLKYPRPTESGLPAWSGPLNAETVPALLDSPARREIARMLMSGDTAVWLLLESGDQQRDAAAARVIETESRKLEQTLALPEPSPLDPPTHPDPPLKIAFSLLRVSRTDPAEQVLASQLVNWNTNLVAATEPLLFPVFGRGRTGPPAAGAVINAETLRRMAGFLTGPCSCEIKDLNPGHDLLLAANWATLPGYQEIPLPEPPPLAGPAQLAAATGPAKPPAPPAALPPDSAHAPGGYLARNLGILGGIIAVFLAGTTLLIHWNSGRR